MMVDTWGVWRTIPLLLSFFIWQMALARDPRAGQEQGDAADQNFDYMFKLLIIGNSSVGKTSFLFRYADNSFTSAFVSTVGIDFKVKTIFRNDKRVKLQIWVRWKTALRRWSLKYAKKDDWLVSVTYNSNNCSVCHLWRWKLGIERFRCIHFTDMFFPWTGSEWEKENRKRNEPLVKSYNSVRCKGFEEGNITANFKCFFLLLSRSKVILYRENCVALLVCCSLKQHFLNQ